jgi:hypothetical protein
LTTGAALGFRFRRSDLTMIEGSRLCQRRPWVVSRLAEAPHHEVQVMGLVQQKELQPPADVQLSQHRVNPNPAGLLV